MPFALPAPACVLCRRAEADPHVCGHKFEKDGLYAHACCLVSSWGSLPLSPRQPLPPSPHQLLVWSLLQWFANGLRLLRGERGWLISFLRDIRHAAERAAQQVRA